MQGSSKIITTGQQVIRTEAQAVAGLESKIDTSFAKACAIILSSIGRVIVIGMGKSGHVGNKIAATLASTGTPAFFVHPCEASHGDLGMITNQDVVIVISNSGETEELLLILPIIKRLNIPLIAMTGKPQSTIAQNADTNLDVSVDKEACPHNLAPTSSTTATLAMGDALAVSLLEARGFTPEDFARSHPAGSLGRRLLLHVRDIMHAGDKLPVVKLGTPFGKALVEMTDKRLGMLAIIDDTGQLAGVFTDGDLRRALNNKPDLDNSLIDEFITQDCVTITPEPLTEVALNIMEDKNINGLIVVDQRNHPVGALNMLDLVHAKVL